MTRTGTLRSLRRERFREWRRDSLWLWPAVAAIAAWALAELVSSHSPSFAAHHRLFSVNIDDARSLLGTIAASILTFTGVVFSITLVALQTASSQYSPRVLRTFVRKPVTKLALASFIATFVYSLVVLARLGTLGGGDRDVPAGAIGVAFLLVLVSVFVFVAFVHSTVRSMRVTYVIEAVHAETVRAIHTFRMESPPAVAEVPVAAGRPTTALRSVHRGGVLNGIDLRRLVQLATERDVTLVLNVEVGTYVALGSHFMDCEGADPPSADEVLSCLDLAAVRTLYQDARYGIRQLVDIAIRALSPAVNDPTTAVQALDRLHDILLLSAAHPDPSGRYFDRGGRLRLVRPVATWVRVADLCFTEIVRYGADSPQISRKLMSIFDELDTVLEGERRDAVATHRGLLERAVAQVTPDPVAHAHALTADALGLG